MVRRVWLGFRVKGLGRHTVNPGDSYGLWDLGAKEGDGDGTVVVQGLAKAKVNVPT